MVKRYYKEIAVFLLIGLIFMTFRRHYGRYEVHRNIENQTFNGIVEGITIGSRNIPIFIVNGTKISLGGYGHNLKKHLEIGDSIYKMPGTSQVVIIEYYYHDTITVDVLDNSINTKD